MILYPAIDLKGGQCVRLLRGDMDKATVFNTDPAAQARAFVEQGATHLHVVDLDGAFSGHPLNQIAAVSIFNVARQSGIQTQIGGGIRDLGIVGAWRASGADRVILGTVAAENPAFVRLASDAQPGRIVVGIDARDGKVATHGWAQTTELTAFQVADNLRKAGATAIVYTDINRDGMLQGVNVEATAALAKYVNIPVIASGGVSSLDDIRALKDSGVSGAILGRALYERRFELADALKIANA